MYRESLIETMLQLAIDAAACLEKAIALTAFAEFRLKEQPADS
jgi:hypothetical protein